MGKTGTRNINYGHIRGEYPRPRRANPDTLSYLRSLPLLDEGTDEEELSNIARVVVEEIKHEMASLAAEEASILQRLIPLTDCRIWFQELAPYVVFLSTHRYGSHVLQTLLEQREGDKVDDSTGTSDNQQYSSVSESLEQWSQALWDYGDQLIRHGCASHVLRSLFLYWGGYNPADFTGGHKRPDQYDGANQTVIFQASHSPIMQETFKAWVDAILGDEGLLDLCCNATSGPLIGIMIRVCAGTDGMEFTVQSSREDQQLGRWKQQAILPHDHPIFQAIVSHVPTLVLDRHGSRLLEELLKVSDSDSWQILRKHFPAVPDLIRDDIGNFGLQALLMTAPDSDCFKEILHQISPHMPYLLDRSNRRLGIIWRLVGSSVRLNCHDHSLLKQIKGDNKDFVSWLLHMKPSENGRLSLDVNGARIVNCLLQYDTVDVGKSISRLTAEDLENLAKDGMGSRCVWDGFTEAAHAKVCKKVLEKLTGRWVALATDRIGHHCVRKLFKALPSFDDKETLTRELSNALKRLTGNAMGRTIINECAVDVYRNHGVDKWRKLVKKDLLKESFVDEIVAAGDEKRKGSHLSSNSAKQAKKKMRKSSVTIESIMNALSVPNKEA